MKLHIWKYLVTQISYFKSQLDPASLGGGQLGGPGILEILKAVRTE